ncbi:MAG: hypothetical protein V4488_19090 [Pseudomonadota bacterium]
MKAFALISIMAALSGAPAVKASDTDTVSISAPAPRIELPSKFYKMWPEEFYNYIQSYSLSDGKTLSVFSRGRKMYAAVEGLPAHEIVATASNTFVALDQKLQMTIELLDNGDARGELLMVVPAERIGNRDAAGEKFVAVSFR